MEELLRNISTLWCRQYEAAKKAKKGHFADSARELWRFLGASWTALYSPDSADRSEWKDYQFPEAKQSYFKPRINLSAKYVAVMAPYINARVPSRLVSPSRPPLPRDLVTMVQQQMMLAEQAAVQGGETPAMLSEALTAVAQAIPQQEELRVNDQLRAFLLQWFVSWLPGEYGLIRESKMAVIEALVKGMGIVWQARTPGPTGDIPISEYDSIDHYFIDGDAKRRRDAGFIIREREESVWRVAHRNGLDPDMLRGVYKSRWATAAQNTGGEQSFSDGDAKNRGDVCKFIEIWSRVGLGQHFGIAGDKMKEVKTALEDFGPYVHLEVMEGLGYPLNLPPQLFEEPVNIPAIQQALRWPIETYADLANPWPNCILEFIPYADNPYAQSPLEAALPLQVFIDHLYAFVMGAIRRRSKSTVVTSEEMQQALQEAIVYGLDMEVVRAAGSAGQELDKLFHIIDYGEINADLWKIIPIVERAFEEMTGSTPLLSHGGVGPTQPRSATEVSERSQRAQSRPDEYADCAEAWHSAIAKAEAVMARMYVGPEVVAPLLGEPIPELIDPVTGESRRYDSTDPSSIEELHGQLGPLSNLWGILVNTRDPAEAVGEFTYTVEAGSGRRKNKQKQVTDLQSIGQLVTPLLESYMGQTGDTRQVNAWFRMVGDALDVDIHGFELPDLRALVQQQQENEAESVEKGRPPSRKESE